MKLLALLTFLAAALGTPPAQDRPAYAVGQVWEYQTRPQDAGSLLKIQQVEKDPAGRPIYHISVIGLHLPPGHGTEAQHIPVSQKTLDASVTRLSTSSAAFPDPAEGIAIWREANGGVFTLSVAQIIDVIEASLKNPPTG